MLAGYFFALPGQNTLCHINRIDRRAKFDRGRFVRIWAGQYSHYRQERDDRQADKK